MRDDSIVNYERKIEDYYEEIYKEFPYVDKKDIRIIVKWGWRKLYSSLVNGCDFQLTSKIYKVMFHVGELNPDPLKHYNYYVTKLLRKLRLLFRWNHKESWDGYYYASLSDEEYEYAFSNSSKRGPKKHKFKFYNKYMCKNFEDVMLRYSSSNKYTIRFKYTDAGYCLKCPILNCEDIELYAALDKVGLKFSDVLVENNNYKF